METKNNNRLKMNDIIDLYKDKKNDVVIKEPDNQGRRSIYIKDKLYGKICQRKYGISWQKHENGEWKTDKFHTIKEFQNKVDGILNGGETKETKDPKKPKSSTKSKTPKKLKNANIV